MKKIISLLLMVAMCLSLAACGGNKETNNDNQNTNSQQETTQLNGDESNKDEQSLEETIVAALDAEYLTGVWVMNEEKSATLTKTRSFELYADGTGKILTAADEELVSATFEWNIKEEFGAVEWTKVSVANHGGYMLQLDGNDLMDLTGSDFFVKETK